MRHIIPLLIAFGALLFTQSCQKEEIYLYNTQNTPDLSNPVIQKVTNIVWYKEVAFGSTTTEQIWTSQNNIYKPGDYVSSVLYHHAWTDLILYRDGTSVMTFVPPFAQQAVIHSKGNWMVSTEEENTIVISTKTPVSSVTAKIKILNMETKENGSIVKISVDFGDRLIITELSNNNPFGYVQDALFRALDYNWYADKTVLTAPINPDEFIGTWAGHDDDHEFGLTDYDMIRYTHMEDLLSSTPTFLSGVSFDLKKGGEAKILYTGSGMRNVFNTWTEAGQTVYSNAKWSVNGNKILVTSDEEVFFSFGEMLFAFIPHLTNLTLLGYDGPTAIRTRAKQLYSIEIVEKVEKGYWVRATTKTEIFYAFLRKSTFDESKGIHIKDLF